MTTSQIPLSPSREGATTQEHVLQEMTYAEAVRLALREEMQRDPRVFLMGEDIGIYGGAFGVTRGLFEEFGEERVRDTPISEAAIAGAAIGAALTGMRPVAEFQFSDFMAIAMDQIVNQGAKLRFMFGGKGPAPAQRHSIRRAWKPGSPMFPALRSYYPPLRLMPKGYSSQRFVTPTP
jgi:hypothetical protein